MINNITVTNYLNEELVISLSDPASSGLAISYIEGLDPPDASINITKRALLDGAQYNSSSAKNRQIIIKFVLFGTSEMIPTIRRKIYKYFPLKTKVKLIINEDTREVFTEGYIEKNTITIFSDRQEATISITCQESYLYDKDESITEFSSVVDLFEFPFSNESLVTPLLEFSELVPKTEKTVEYHGDASIGFLLEIHATGSATGVTLINSRTLNSIDIDSTKLAALTGSDISNGDTIYISTVLGDKYAKLVRGGNTYNILSCLTVSSWFQLNKGDNIYAFDATSGLANLEFKITNKVAYEGI